MRWSTPLLALLAAAPQARAQDAPPAHGAPPTEAAIAPATVLDHQHDIWVDGYRRLHHSQAWTVRIHDPQAASAGLPAPPGLDGATDGSARVLGDLLLVPGGTAAGDTFTLETSGRDRRGPWSGVFATAPDLPAEQAGAKVQVPSWVPVTVWADAHGEPTWSRPRRARAIEIDWTELPAGRTAQLVWTTWPDWAQAGEALLDQVEPLLADKQELGRDIAHDVEGVSLAELVDRITPLVNVYPEDYGRWATARSATEVLADGEGTAADRGVALLSLLRVAGYDARPAVFRVRGATRVAPLTVPAPAQFDRPAVAVVTDKRVVWLDPASPHTALPDLPASMVGAVAWVPGRLPTRLAAHGVMDGLVSINGRVRFDQDGAASWSGTLTASGAAREWIRSLLAPVDPADREQVVMELIQMSRPGLERFTMSASGVEDPARALKISVQGHQAGAVEPRGPGGVAILRPLLAPGLASWLPPRILVHEEVAVDAPPGMQPVAVVPAEPTWHREVVLARHLHREAERLILITEAQRPVHTDTPARAAEATRFLGEHAGQGPQVLYFGMPSPALARALRSTDALGSAAERYVLEALLWLAADDETRARRIFRRALKETGPTELAAEIRRYGSADDPRPWQALYDATRNDERVWIVAVEGLEDTGAPREAWVGAAALSESLDPEVRLRALRVMYRLQPDQRPNQRIDEVGHEAWLPRSEIVTRAHEASRAVADAPVGGDRPILLARARRELEHGRSREALVLVDRILKMGADPVADVLRARARAALDVPAADLAAEIESAVDRSPFDAEVLGEAARAMAAVDRDARAAELALDAARLAFTDPARWSLATDLALAAGDLPTAAYAGRRASDLAPDDVDLAERLQLVATLIGDQDGATLGATRAGIRPSQAPWPSSLDGLMTLAPAEALLALLQHHDDEVTATPRLLRMRAQLRLDNDLLDGAARDGVILASRHQDPRGWALAFAATAGRLWSTDASEHLDEHLDHPQVRATRLEYGLLTTDGDPLRDARALAEDRPRAEVVVRVVSDPGAIATEHGAWPAELADPEARAPAGYRANRILGAVDGVAAWSHRDRATAVLRTATITDHLPPPLSHLYTPRRPDVASLDDRGRVVRLDGGPLPVYAAIQPLGGHQVLGLGFTAPAAQRALADGLAAWADEQASQ